LVTVAEACKRLAISRPTLYGLFAADDIRSLQIGRARRVPVAEIESYIERRLSGGDAA
jgi:excisionase family DNA binding protein